MNAKNLSRRLAKVASYVQQDAILADIGSDHAYLPCWLVQNGTIRKAVAGEVVRGPFESASRTVEKEGLADRITVRFADGLLAIEPDDGVTVITIAGMGGTLIASILAAAPDRLEGVTRLILQPNLHAKAIREWAVGNGWKVTEEAILKEDRKLYEVLVLERGMVRYSEEELLMGPFLMKEPAAAFREKWEGELTELTRVCAALDASAKTDESIEKRRQLGETKQLIERVLQQ